MSKEKTTTYESESQSATYALAADVIEKLLSDKRKGALVVALHGELGAGKTQFVKGAADFLGIMEVVTSPTFLILRSYPVPAGRSVQKLYHLDCYRVHDAHEVLALGWEDFVAKSDNIVFVEWAERVQDILPADTVHVHIRNKGECGRSFLFTTQTAHATK